MVRYMMNMLYEIYMMIYRYIVDVRSIYRTNMYVCSIYDDNDDVMDISVYQQHNIRMMIDSIVSYDSSIQYILVDDDKYKKYIDRYVLNRYNNLRCVYSLIDVKDNMQVCIMKDMRYIRDIDKYMETVQTQDTITYMIYGDICDDVHRYIERKYKNVQMIDHTSHIVDTYKHQCSSKISHIQRHTIYPLDGILSYIIKMVYKRLYNPYVSNKKKYGYILYRSDI